MVDRLTATIPKTPIRSPKAISTHWTSAVVFCYDTVTSTVRSIVKRIQGRRYVVGSMSGSHAKIESHTHSRRNDVSP